ncbi:hypothetical protein KPL71_009228 [Citrus sinensis]|uniref:Uncharacterized protein n=1 Tax=Citrus sinensis TaxID=2711 RepID=A0ACB8MC36_CITSI|nr:hypothetical protein KPL71_009228 [Citrus sinensis]
MASSSLSSSSSRRLRDQWRYKHDVFVTFSGEDIRENFGSYLFAALFRESVKTFRDEQIRRGDEIMPALLQAIEESKISLVIFSKRFAFSRWCLEELVKIIECNKLYQTVIPVFYKVLPSDVRNQLGSFGEAFLEHEKSHDLRPKVGRWRDALREASDLAGWDSNVTRPESKLTDEIVNGVVENLKSFAELMEKELVVLFNRARDKLDNHASSLSNNEDFKQLYCRLDEVLSLLRNAEGYRSYRCWLLCPLFSELRVLTNDVHQLMDNYENSDVTLAKFEGEVKKLDQRLLRFLESVDKHVASYDRYGSASFEQPRPQTTSAAHPYVEDVIDDAYMEDITDDSSPSLNLSRINTVRNLTGSGQLWPETISATDTCTEDVTVDNSPSLNLSSCNSSSTFKACLLSIYLEAIFKLEIHHDNLEAWRAAFSIVSEFIGITKISFDFKVKKMTVVGDNFDVLSAGTKLNGLCRTELVSFGQAKEPEEGEHDKAESNEANKKEERKLPISFLSRM